MPSDRDIREKIDRRNRQLADLEAQVVDLAGQVEIEELRWAQNKLKADAAESKTWLRWVFFAAGWAAGLSVGLVA